MTNDTNRRRVLCALSTLLLGLFYLTDPLTHHLMRGAAASTTSIAMTGFVAPFVMVLTIGTVVGLMQLLRHRADRAGLVGGTLTLLGWAVGSRIIALGQLESLLQSGATPVPPDTLQKMFDAAPIVWVSIVPMGLFFPIGLITLGIALAATAPITRWLGALLAVGGLLFPIGRAVRVSWAIVACDAVLGVTFVAIGWLLWTRTELWMRATSGAPPAAGAEGLRPDGLAQPPLALPL